MALRAPSSSVATAARAGAVLLALSGPAACGGSSTRRPPPSASAMTVTSPAFGAGGTIPVRYTCAGDNQSPPLAWSGVPSGAVEVAVVVDDPDARPGPFVHWVLTGLSPTRTALGAGERPGGAVEARGSSGEAGYTGPCPPDHETHHYRFTVYALRSRAGLAPGTSPSSAVATIKARAMTSATLVATFGR